MGVRFSGSDVWGAKADAVVLLTAEDRLSQHAKRFEKQINKIGFKPEFGKVLFIPQEGASKGVIIVGLGKAEEMDLEKIRKAYAVSVAEGINMGFKSLATQLPDLLNQKDVARACVEGFVLGNYSFAKYKKDSKFIDEFLIAGGNVNDVIDESAAICGNVNFVRDTINEPGTPMNTVALANLIKDVAGKCKLKCTVFELNELKKMGMNMIINVGMGARCPPKLAIIEYYGNRGSKETIALVGKGITFDSGGINLKPSGYIETMKLDKSGAVTVLGVIKTAAELKLKKNLIGVMPLCENIIGPDSYKPGDIIKSYTGKTVEIGNTDAEGRLILGDALAYAEKKYKPSLMIDLATLTGAALVVTGEYVAPIISNDDKYSQKLFDVGQRLYERVWRLPLYDEYKDEMKGEISDIRNIGYRGATGSYAGTITGGAFLSYFVEKTPWIHIDIAGTAWYEKPRYYVPKGATGWGVRLLVEFLRSI